MKVSRSIMTAAGAAIAVLGLAACAPGGSGADPSATLGPVSADISDAGDITLTVWDQNTDDGINEAQEALNAAFEAKYPNVTIERVTQSFNDMKTTLRLALSGDNPPDVVQANQGYPDMGAFVEAGLLRPLNDYKDLYGWGEYYPEGLLKLNSFSADGSTWQGDNLYGISQTGEVVGIYYNKSILKQLGVSAPTSLRELKAAMAAAKSAGILPLEYGDVEKSPGIHLYGVVQAAVAGADAVNDLVTGASGAWTDESSVEAAQTVADWSAAGYIPGGANGISRDDALASFEAGGSAFYITGTWKQSEVTATMGDDAGFTTLIPEGSEVPATTGGEGLAWAVTTGTKNSDVAAAYINFINSADAAQQFLAQNSLPSVLPADYQPAAGTLAADIADAYRASSDGGGVVPYLDYATSTFYDTLASAVQELTDGKLDADSFAQTLQDDYAAFLDDKN